MAAMPERRTKNRSPGLPSVPRAHNDLVGAADALAEAVALHEEKGNVLPARRCRQLLATIAAGGPAANAQMAVSRAAEGQQTP